MSDLLAGNISGVLATIFVHPIDTVKVMISGFHSLFILTKKKKKR